MPIDSNTDKYIDSIINNINKDNITNNQYGGEILSSFGIDSIIVSVNNIVERLLRLLPPLDEGYERLVGILTVIRVLYILLLVILISLKFLNIWSPSSYALYHGYSIIKLIYYIIIYKWTLIYNNL